MPYVPSLHFSFSGHCSCHASPQTTKKSPQYVILSPLRTRFYDHCHLLVFFVVKCMISLKSFLISSGLAPFVRCNHLKSPVWKRLTPKLGSVPSYWSPVGQRREKSPSCFNQHTPHPQLVSPNILTMQVKTNNQMKGMQLLSVQHGGQGKQLNPLHLEMCVSMLMKKKILYPPCY